MQEWLTILKSEGKYDLEKPMLDLGEHELSVTLHRLAKRANINLGNERIRFHNLRVFLITRLSKVMETNRWKQIVGKSVPESSYVKPFLLNDDYRKVLPLTTVNTSASIPQSAELQKIRKRILELEGENVELRRIVMKLAQDLGDVQQRSTRIIEWLTENQQAQIANETK